MLVIRERVAAGRLVPFGVEKNPAIVSQLDGVNTAFVPSATGFTRVGLTPESTSSYDCPTDQTDCTGVDRMCHSTSETYSPALATASAELGTLIVYEHAVSASTTHLYDCQANCSCGQTTSSEGSNELVVERSGAEPSGTSPVDLAGL